MFQHDTVWEHIWTQVRGCVSQKVLGFPTHRSGLIHPNQLDSAIPLFEQCCVQFFKCCSLSLTADESFMSHYRFIPTESLKSLI